MLTTFDPITLTETDTRYASESSRTLARLIQQHSEIHLRSDEVGAEDLVLPPGVAHALQTVLEQIGQGQTVVVLPIESELTTGQAAELIGVSRPFLVHLLESGDIPFHLAGTHRRVRLQDVLAYKQEKQRQRAILDELTREAQELDMGY